MKTTNNLFLIGFMGAGKSSVSAALGQKLGRAVVEMDQCISENEGMTIPEIFTQKGEPYFRTCETALLQGCAQGEPRIISCGGGVPMREENVAAMRAWAPSSCSPPVQRSSWSESRTAMTALCSRTAKAWKASPN